MKDDIGDGYKNIKDKRTKYGTERTEKSVTLGEG